MRIFSATMFGMRAQSCLLVRRLAAARADCDVYYAPKANAAGAFWIARVGEEISTSDVFLLFMIVSLSRAARMKPDFMTCKDWL